MNRLTNQSLLVLLTAVLYASIVAAKGSDLPRPADPFLDPKHDPYNPLKYITSNALGGVAFSLILLVGLIQTYFVWRYRTKWMLSMVIGAYTFAFGLSTRFGLHIHPESKGLYIVEYLFVVLSPCAFIAADYVLLGRLASHIDASKYLLVPSRRITIIFVSSDISTFLVQAVGGSFTASSNAPKTALIGSRIFLAGLALQLVSFLIFTFIYLVFLYRVHKHSPDTWTMNRGQAWYNDWRCLAGALFISCIGILIRSGFRVVELSEGFQGRLATSEAFFYGLDTLPLFIAIALYIPFWPGRFIPTSPAGSSEPDNSDDMDEKSH